MVYKDVTSSAAWSSSDVAVATVNNGLVTGTGVGSATITASLDGKTGTTLVVVGQTLTREVTPTTPGTFSLSASPDQHFQASAHYSDGTVLELESSRSPGILRPFRLHARTRRGSARVHGDGDRYSNPGLRTRGFRQRNCVAIA
jgi:hypothetical protein